MTPADLIPSAPLGEATAPVETQVTVRGWGGGPGVPVGLVRPDGVAALRTAVARSCAGAEPRGAIARGMGRSYGDAAHLNGGLVLDTTRLAGLALDGERGSVTAQAGVTLGALLRTLVPAGYMLPVVPGTQHVTVGGAVASDIHGKNHGVAGTFGHHVEALGLVNAAGELVELTPESDRDLFTATVGGMGLTGVIAWVRITLQRIGGPFLSVDTDRVAGLDEALAALREPGGPHRVAWLDLLGTRPGRGVVTRAELQAAAPVSGGARNRASETTPAARANVPARWPGHVLRPSVVKAHNELRYRLAPRRERGRLETIGAHMFPLDALAQWPRLYGPRGLIQYQFAIPTGHEHVLIAVIERLRRARVPCYLAVLKDFGPAADAPLSFPLEGWTLALDLPRAAPGVAPLLDGFDEVVAAAGGRVYLSKDARLRPDAVAAMYPRLREWQAVRERADPEHRWRSDLALRTGLVDLGGDDTRPRRDVRSPPRAAAHREPERRVLLVGGSSEIGQAIVRRLAAEGPLRPYLLGRDRGRLADSAAMLARAGCTSPEFDLVDAANLAAHERVIVRAFERTGGFELVVLAVGVLGAQAGLDADPTEAAEVMSVDFVGSGSLLLECMRAMREQGGGTLIVLSSVAVERPRAANAIYGAAKAGLDALAQGLADAAVGSGVRVLVVRPGFVATRMTAGLDPPPLATTPEAVAQATVRALAGHAHTVWVPGLLRPIFAVLRHAPRGIYRRLPL